MVSNAQATTKGAIILLTNFVFISVIFFHCFGLPWLPTVGGHFWPFTQVLRKIWPGVTRKVGKTADDTDVTDGFLDWRLTQTHYNWMPDWPRWVRHRRAPYLFPICVILATLGEFYFGAGFTAAFPRRVFGKRVRCAKGPRSDRV